MYLCLKWIKYICFKIFKKGPFILITSLQRIVSVILEIIREEFKISVVSDEKQEEGKEKNYRKSTELARVILASVGPKRISVLNCLWMQSSGWNLEINNASRIDKRSSLLKDTISPAPTLLAYGIFSFSPPYFLVYCYPNSEFLSYYLKYYRHILIAFKIVYSF